MITGDRKHCTIADFLECILQVFWARRDWALAELFIQVWLIFLQERYTDEHGSFSFVSETRKAEEEVSNSSFAFPASEANEKLSC